MRAGHQWRNAARQQAGSSGNLTRLRSSPPAPARKLSGCVALPSRIAQRPAPSFERAASVLQATHVSSQRENLEQLMWMPLQQKAKNVRGSNCWHVDSVDSCTLGLHCRRQRPSYTRQAHALFKSNCAPAGKKISLCIDRLFDLSPSSCWLTAPQFSLTPQSCQCRAPQTHPPPRPAAPSCFFVRLGP